jgi:hypothetical protein
MATGSPPTEKPDSLRCLIAIRDVGPDCYRLPGETRMSALRWRNRRTVAIQLATFASGDGSDAFPSNARIAAATGLSLRAVQYAWSDLATLGLVEDTGKFHERYHTKIRKVNIEKILAVEPLPPKKRVRNGGANLRATGTSAIVAGENLRDEGGANLLDVGANLRARGVQTFAPRLGEGVQTCCAPYRPFHSPPDSLTAIQDRPAEIAKIEQTEKPPTTELESKTNGKTKTVEALSSLSLVNEENPKPAAQDEEDQRTVGDVFGVWTWADMDELTDGLLMTETHRFQSYEHPDEFEQIIQGVIAEKSDQPFRGRTTLVEIMHVAMRRLKKIHKVNAPAEWVPTLKLLQGKSTKDDDGTVSPIDIWKIFYSTDKTICADGICRNEEDRRSGGWTVVGDGTWCNVDATKNACTPALQSYLEWCRNNHPVADGTSAN